MLKRKIRDSEKKKKHFLGFRRKRRNEYVKQRIFRPDNIIIIDMIKMDECNFVLLRLI